MAWTYSGDPTASPLDEVRFLIGDTVATDPQLQDGEINYQIVTVAGALSSIPSAGNFLAAAYCCDALVARFARFAESKTVGDLSLSYGQRVQQYADLAYRLRQRAAIAAVKVTVTGQSIAAKKANNADPDRIPLASQIDGMSYASPLNSLNNTNVGP